MDRKLFAKVYSRVKASGNPNAMRAYNRLVKIFAETSRIDTMQDNLDHLDKDNPEYADTIKEELYRVQEYLEVPASDIMSIANKRVIGSEYNSVEDYLYDKGLEVKDTLDFDNGNDKVKLGNVDEKPVAIQETHHSDDTYIFIRREDSDLLSSVVSFSNRNSFAEIKTKYYDSNWVIKNAKSAVQKMSLSDLKDKLEEQKTYANGCKGDLKLAANDHVTMYKYAIDHYSELK